MIECKNGCSETKGNVPGLLSEYTVITRHIREVLTKKHVRRVRYVYAEKVV